MGVDSEACIKCVLYIILIQKSEESSSPQQNHPCRLFNVFFHHPSILNPPSVSLWWQRPCKGQHQCFHWWPQWGCHLTSQVGSFGRKKLRLDHWFSWLRWKPGLIRPLLGLSQAKQLKRLGKTCKNVSHSMSCLVVIPYTKYYQVSSQPPQPSSWQCGPVASKCVAELGILWHLFDIFSKAVILEYSRLTSSPLQKDMML